MNNIQITAAVRCEFEVLSKEHTFELFSIESNSISFENDVLN